MNKYTLWLVILIFAMACKSRKSKGPEAAFFPVLSFLKGQAAAMDSSLYRIIKIETAGNKVDTSYIKREAFKTYAADFLNLPDIGSDKLKDQYEESKINDDDLKSYILTYTTKEKNNEVQRQDVMIDQNPDINGNSQVKTIIIDKWVTGEDSSIHKNMVWEINNRFLIVTKVQKQNQPERISKLEVIWNNLPGL